MIYHWTTHVGDPQTSLFFLNLLGFSTSCFTVLFTSRHILLVCILLANILPSIVVVCNYVFDIYKYIIKYVTLMYYYYYRIVYY